MCVTEIEDVMRFFYRSPKGGASLEVTIDVKAKNGRGINTWSMSSSGKKWGVSPKIDIPAIRDNGKVWIVITFENTGRTNLLIDDVMIDPWVAR